MNLPRMKLTVGTHAIDAYVARTPEHRALGLMHRRELEPNEGMLFVEDEPCPQSYWMKDTPVALSIAFIEDDGTIVQIGDLEPNCLDPHRCNHPVRFVLEVPQGWFAERGIVRGHRIDGPVFVALGSATVTETS